MTGQHNFRNYYHFGYLDPGETTFAHLLREAGYDTAAIGKWQLYDNVFEDLQGSLPAAAGFDEFLLWQVRSEEKGSRYWGPTLNHNGVLKTHQEIVFGPDLLNDAAKAFVTKEREGPFFLYYPMVLPHDPWVTTPDRPDTRAGAQERFAAMVNYMDKLVVQLRDTVVDAGLADSTVILFVGDNGTGREITSRANGVAVRGAKGTTLTAGSRVPYIAWGPGHIAAGQVSDALVNLNDVLPTLLALAGVEPSLGLPLDGFSLLPLLRGEQRSVRDNLFIHYEPRWPSGLPARYAFDTRFKLYQEGGFYDTFRDPLEQQALAIDELDGAARAAYQELRLRLASMPGELLSSGRWLPPQFYYALGLALLVIVLAGWLALRLVWSRRRDRG